MKFPTFSKNSCCLILFPFVGYLIVKTDKTLFGRIAFVSKFSRV